MRSGRRKEGVDGSYKGVRGEVEEEVLGGEAQNKWLNSTRTTAKRVKIDGIAGTHTHTKIFTMCVCRFVSAYVYS